MRRLLLMLLLAGCAERPTGGGGIVSTNPCADSMLVRMVPAWRIAAISHYSQDPGATSIPLDLARRFRATAGTAEEVIALKPDLVLASAFTAPTTRDAYARAGLRTLYLGAPQTIAGSEAQVREVAAAVGARAAGERMVGEIEGALVKFAPPRRTPGSSPAGLRGRSAFLSKDVATGPRRSPGWENGEKGPAAVEQLVGGIEGRPANHAPPRRTAGSSSAGPGGRGTFLSKDVATGPRRSPGWDKGLGWNKGPGWGEEGRGPTALLYISGDLATGSGTLLDELMTRVGLVNAAAGYGLAFTGRLPAEMIVARPPEVVIAPAGGRGAAMRRRLLRGTREVVFPRTLINCGGPTIAPALRRLAAIRDSLA